MIRLIFILFFSISCDSMHNKASHKNNCSDTEKYRGLIATVIEMPELQQYYDVQKIIKQDTLVIVKDHLVKDEFVLTKFGVPVAFFSDSEIIEKKIKAFIKFEELRIGKDSAVIQFKYKIQGIGCKATYHLEDCKWKLKSKHIWEN